MNMIILRRTFLVIFTANAVVAGERPTWLFRSSDALSKNKDRLVGCIVAAASQVPYRVPSLFKGVPEDLLFKVSELGAKRVFWDAYRTVPAYQDFIAKHSSEFPSCFSAIPLMSKKNYIEEYPIEQTLKYGKIPLEGFMDPSSGTSGRRTLWIRGADEIENTQKTMNFVRSMFLGNECYVLINMFLPSAWSLGLMRGLGPNVAEAYETIKDLGTKPKYLIMGHTSLIKYFVQQCPFDLAPFDMTLLIGGEHMSRALRKSFLSKGIKKIYAGYGASDINFTVAIQEDFTQKLQELCLADPALKIELTGSEHGLPYFFQYSPVFDYIEEVDGRLVLTDLDHTRISPRIRYDVGDRGKVLRMSFVQQVLKKRGIKLVAQTNLPLICLYGRVEHTVPFKNTELAFDDLELAILDVPELASVMNQYAYNQVDQEDGTTQLEFWIELKEGVCAARFDNAEIEKKIYAALSAINFGFKRELELDSDHNPILKMYEYKQSPMLVESACRKAKYLYHVSKS